MSAKKIFGSLATLIMLVGLLFSIVGCFGSDKTECEKNGHSWTDATCTSPKTCTVCQATEGEVLGHAFAEATCVAPKTCTTCQATEGEALGHTFAEATCVAPKTCTTCQATEGEALGHSFTEGDCTIPGSCTVCQESSGVAKGHSWSEATCTSPKICTACQATEGEAKGHTEAIDEAISATCTATGLTEGKHCSECNEILVAQQTTQKAAHTYDDKYDESCNVCGAIRDVACAHREVIISEYVGATCTATGLTEGKVCAKCEAVLVEQRVIQALGHSWSFATCTSPKTCDRCNTSEGEALGHTWKNATCTEAKTCYTCQATDGDPLGHSWKNATCTEAKTCIVCQTAEGEPLGHTEAIDAAVPADCITSGLTEGKHCSVCEKVLVAQTVIEPLGHNEEILSAVSASCTSTGLTEGKRCSACNKILVEQIETPKLAHTYDDDYDANCNSCGFERDALCKHDELTVLPAKAATCTATGLTEGKVCAKCEEVIVEQTTVEALGHTEAIDAAVAATCTTTGLTEGKHCSVCNEVLIAQTTTGALVHSWKDATCTKAKTCSVCKVTEGQANGHNISGWLSNSDGTHSKKCYTCGDISETADCKGGSATCKDMAICTECNTPYGITVDHSYTAETIESRYLVSAATCTDSAVYYHSCIYCGQIGETTFIGGSPLGHLLSSYYKANDNETHTRICVNGGCDYFETDDCYGGNTTCTAKAICAFCAQTYGEEPAHDWDGGEITTAPTCTDAGVKTYTCTTCGDTRTESIAANGHNYSNTDVTEPGCLNSGYTTYSCADCDSNYVDKNSYTAALGHAWDKDRSCTDGHTCDRCGESEDALGHNYSVTGSKAADCINDGVNTLECANCGDRYEVKTDPATGHDLTNVEPEYRHVEGCQYSREYHCTKCGVCVNSQTVYNHSYSASITTPATCTAEGVKTISCTACGDSYTEDIPVDKTIGHNWVSGEAVNGKRTDSCACGETKTVTVYTDNKTEETKAEDLKDSEIELNDASINLGKDVIDSIGADTNITVSADKIEGDEEKKNAGLNEEQLAQVGDNPIYNFTINDGEISDFGKDNYVTITLPYTLEEGEDVDNIAVWFITGEVDEFGNPILEAIKATYNNGYVTFKTNHFSYYTVTRLTPAQRCELYGHVMATGKQVAATCTEDGYIIDRCIRCAQSWKTVTEVAEGHKLTTETIAATCTADGKETVSCASCNYFVEKKLAATGHSHTVTEVAEASCTSEGYVIYACHCGHSYMERSAKLQHEYSVTVVDPGCGKAGYTRHECELCHYYYDDNTTAPKDHEYICNWQFDSNHNHATPVLVCDCGEEIWGDRVNATKTKKNNTCGNGGTVEYTYSYTFNGITYTHLYSEDGTPTGEHDVDFHKYKSNNSYHWYECKECGEESGREEHQWDNGKITVNPTCAKNGEITYSCTTLGCDRTYKEKLEPTGYHHFQNGVCVSCGLDQGCDHTLKKVTINLEDYGCCTGTIVYEVCDCGKKVGQLIDLSVICDVSDGYGSENGVDSNGNEYSKIWGTCHECRMYVEGVETYTNNGDCTYSYVLTYDLYDVNGNLIVSASIYDTDYAHEYEFVDIAASNGICSGTYFNVEKCINCGAYGNFDDVFSFEGCQIESTQQDYSDDTKEYRTETGICSVCGLKFIAEYGMYLEGCERINYITITIYKNGEEIYSHTRRDSEYIHQWNEIYEYLGDSCDDGVKVYRTCGVCGEEQEYVSIGHNYGDSEMIYLAEKGMCDYTYVQKQSCKICGYTEYYDFTSFDCDWNREGTDENGYDIYRCAYCQAVRYQKSASVESNNCTTEIITDYRIFNKNMELILEYTEKNWLQRHNYEYTFELYGDSCEDGVSVYIKCRDCGVSMSTTIAHHSLYEVEYYDLTALGACGHENYLSIRSCPCGQEKDTLLVGCCSGFSLDAVYVDENGVEHYSYSSKCVDCLLAVYKDTYVQWDGCEGKQYSKYYITIDGNHVVETEYYPDGETLDRHEYNYTFDLHGDSCEDGVTIYYTCVKCGYGYENYTESHEMLGKKYDLSEYGVCGSGYIYMYNCACGMSSFISADYYHCSYITLRDSYVDTEGREHSLVTTTCSECGVVITCDTYYVTRGCVEYRYVKYSVAMNGETVIDTDYAVEVYSNNHKYNVTYEFEGDSCEDGIIQRHECTVCGYVVNYTYNYHHVSKVADYDFSEYKICNSDGFIAIYSCPCGKEGYIRNYNYYCSFSSDYSEYYDENGNYHAVEKLSCSTCGLIMTVDYCTEVDGCRTTFYQRITLELDGTQLVDTGFCVNGYNIVHDYEYSYNLSGDSCLDGVEITAECKNCDESYYDYQEFHVNIPVETIHINVGTPCETSITYNRCPCGEYDSVDYVLHGTTNYNTQIIEGGIVQTTESNYCSKCGMRFTHKWYEVDNGNCTRTTYNDYMLVVDGELLFEKQSDVTWECHNIKVTGALEGGATNCDEGVIITYQCVNCDYGYTERHHYHYEIEIESLDVIEHGGDCGGRLSVIGCACGMIEPKIDINNVYCDLEYDYVPIWVDGYIQDYYSDYYFGKVYFDYSAYGYYCSVTDPEVCGFAVRYAYYWRAAEDSCTAYRCYSVQVYNRSTGEIYFDKEYIFDAYEETYHRFETSMDNPEVRICSICGSYYGTEYITEYHETYGELNGYRQISVDVPSGRIHEYKTLTSWDGVYSVDYNRDVNSKGTERWNMTERINDFSFSAPFGDDGNHSIQIYSDSNGVWEKTEFAYVRYLGGQYTIFSYSENQDGYYTREDYQYNYDENGVLLDCSYILTHNDNGDINVSEGVDHKRYTTTTVKEPTCTQYGERSRCCRVCQYAESTYQISPSGHNWVDVIGTDIYVCSTCGMQGLGGADGDVILEDLTEKYGNGENYVVGYLLHTTIELDNFVSIVDKNGEIIAHLVVDVHHVSGEYVGLWVSKAEVEAAAAETLALLGYDGEYDIRISFVPVDSDGSFDYGITFGDLADIDESDVVVSTDTSLTVYVDSHEATYITIRPESDSIWHIYSNNAEGYICAELYDENMNRLMFASHEKYGNFDFTYTLEAGKIYYLGVGLEYGHMGYVNLCLGIQTDLTGHEHSYSVNVVAPTCQSWGYEIYTCTVCQYSYIESDTAAPVDHVFVGGWCQWCGMYDNSYNPEGIYVFNIQGMPTFSAGSKQDGEFMSFDGIFTVYFTQKSMVSGANNTFPDGMVTGQRLRLYGETVIGTDNGGTQNAIRFDVSAPTTVKVWWIAGAEGNAVAIYDQWGNIVAQSGEVGSKQGAYVSELCISDAGTYYLGNIGSTNYYAHIEVTIGLSDHVHNYVISEIPATCTEPGYFEYICIDCGVRLVEESSPAIGHYFIDGYCISCGAIGDCNHDYQIAPYHYEYVGATCTTTGIDVYECIYCGDYYTKESPVDPTMHKWDYDNIVVDIAPDCSTGTNGLETYTCTECGGKGQFEIYAYHNFDEIYVEPTCTTDGSYYGKCTVCGYEESDIYPAYGHYAWDLSCGESGYCNACGELITLDHTTIVEATCKRGAYCLDCGATVGDPIPHNYVDGACSMCGSVACVEMSITEALAAPEGSGVTVTGTIVEIASAFDGKYTSLYIADGAGNQIYLMRLYGGKELGVGDIITASGAIRLYKETNAVYNGSYVKQSSHICSEFTVATCTEPSACVMCGMVVSEALGHVYGENVQTVDPTCTEPGHTIVDCLTCGEMVVVEEFSALGHSYVDGICERCGHAEYAVVTILEALSTPDGVGVIVTGTIDEARNRTFYIADENGNRLYLYNLLDSDDLVVGDVITVKGQISTYNNQKQIKQGTYEIVSRHECTVSVEATCTTGAICDICGSVVIKALGHSFVDGICERCGEEEPEMNASYVLDIQRMDTFTKGNKEDGETAIFADFFTVHYSNMSAVNNISETTFDDGFAATKRFTLRSVTAGNMTKNVIEFTVGGASTVKIWWLSSSATARIALYDAAGNVVAEVTGTGEKNVPVISEIAISDAGTYYIGSSYSTSYLYNLEVSLSDGADAPETPEEPDTPDNPGEGEEHVHDEYVDQPLMEVAGDTGTYYVYKCDSCGSWIVYSIKE